MALSARELKTVVSIVAGLIFGVPLAVLFVSLNSWEPELDRRPQPSLQPPSAAPVAPRPRTVPAVRAPAVPGLPSGPLAVELRRRASDTVEVVLRNVSTGKMKVAIPGDLGGLIVVARASEDPAPGAGRRYDEARDDFVLPLRPGASHTVVLRSSARLPGGQIRAIYDSRSPDVPDDAWKGRVVSPVVGIAGGARDGGR